MDSKVPFGENLRPELEVEERSRLAPAEAEGAAPPLPERRNRSNCSLTIWRSWRKAASSPLRSSDEPPDPLPARAWEEGGGEA